METTSTKTQTNAVPVISILMMGTFLAILNQTLMTTALPNLMKEFSVTTTTAQWLTTGFMLVNGIMIPVTGFLIRRFPVRNLFFTAMSLFALGTLFCATAPSFGFLLAGRMIQASGAGILMPLMQTVLFVVFPPAKRGVAMGIFGLVVAFAPAIGPTYSGFIIDHFEWRVLFYTILPLALIILAIAFFLVKNVTETKKTKVDFLSIILSSFGFGGLLYGVSTASSNGWTSGITMGSILGALVVLGLFIYRQFKLTEPMLDFRIFKYEMFTLPMIMVIIVFMSFIGSMTLLPIFMQNVLHFSALKSGFALLIGGTAMGILSPITGKLYDLVGAKPLALVGLSFVGISSFLLTRVSITTDFTYIALVFMLLMIGEAIVMMPLTTAALNALPFKDISHGTAMNNTLRQIGGAIGTAILVTIMSSNILDVRKYGLAGVANGVQAAFYFLVVVSCIGFILALFIKKVPKKK